MYNRSAGFSNSSDYWWGLIGLTLIVPCERSSPRRRPAVHAENVLPCDMNASLGCGSGIDVGGGTKRPPDANREMRTMNATLRWCLVGCFCSAMSGCAMLPALALNLAAQGAQGVVALSLGPMVAMQDASQKDRCGLLRARGLAVTESLEISPPSNEGQVGTFEPVFWRPEFALEGYPEVEQSRTPTEGTLTISDKSVFFVPPPGAVSVRIPYELVQGVDVPTNADTGEPRSMIVKSCFGRFDIVTFRQQQSTKVDPVVTAAAADQLKSRVTKFQSASGN
jgi:hypothetical protein